MSYFTRHLRANYRVTGKELDADAVGEAVVQGSWGGGAGTRRWCGGFIMGSFASAQPDSCLPVSAAGAIASFYGSDGGLSNRTGYKIFPFAAWNACGVGGSVAEFFKLSVSVAGDSCFGIIGIRFSASAGGGAFSIDAVSCGGASIHVVWAGWIVSGP